ncbi:uncharacterized protein LOC134179843 isoform X2 [Corticium candelabrum]|uniref:uncharacterized protein LOC134179843 isoform X2 n=1 Tax=Corticium candelabrum TaxID=121492 RepID=UPI002E270CEE|nr:uncharacterized protein LOC134179843 isoform X2 [Corticium candelabrum]
MLSVLHLRRISRITISLAGDVASHVTDFDCVGETVLNIVEVLCDCLVELHLNIGRLVSCSAWLEDLGNRLEKTSVTTLHFNSAHRVKLPFVGFEKFKQLKNLTIPIKTSPNLTSLCRSVNQLDFLAVHGLKLSDVGLREGMPLGKNIVNLFLVNCHLKDDDVFTINKYMENQLVGLSVERNDVGDAAMRDICIRQNCLMLLNVSQTCITVSGLKLALETLTHLTTLSAGRCRAMAGKQSAIDFKHLQHFRSLDLSGCGAIHVITLSSDSRLEYVNVSSCAAIRECMWTSVCVSLQHLDISNCTGLSQNKLSVMIQSLACNCPHLSQLNIGWLRSVNDEVLFGVKEQRQCTTSSVPLKSLQTRSSTSSLLGKEAKKAATLLCSSFKFVRDETVCSSCVKHKSAEVHRLGIMGLANLTKLCLKACSRITNEALSCALKFSLLTDLDISEINDSGLLDVMIGCPVLERLNVSSCYNIGDFAATMVAQRLKRLTHFGAAYTAISDAGIHALAGGLCRLVCIDISYCTNVTAKSLLVIRLSQPCLLELHARHLATVTGY